MECIIHDDANLGSAPALQIGGQAVLCYTYFLVHKIKPIVLSVKR